MELPQWDSKPESEEEVKRRIKTLRHLKQEDYNPPRPISKNGYIRDFRGRVGSLPSDIERELNKGN